MTSFYIDSLTGEVKHARPPLATPSLADPVAQRQVVSVEQQSVLNDVAGLAAQHRRRAEQHTRRGPALPAP